MADEPSGRPLRRLANPGRALAFLVVTVLVAAVAFVLGALVRSPDASVLDAREETIAVHATVELRVVGEGTRIQGEVIGAITHPIHVVAPAGAALAVVTSVSAGVGSELANGALIGTVSDRPVFVFSLQIPLFRDLRRGDTGSDVASLQAALGVEQSGIVDGSTLDAVRALYASADLAAPGGSGNPYVRLSEFYSVSQTEQLRLGSISAVGSRLGPDDPFASLATGAPYVSVRASVSEADEIAVGDAVSIQRAAGDNVTGVVDEIGEFASAGTAAGRPPGRDIRIGVPPDTTLEPGEPVAVVFGTEAEPQLAVPTLAIRSDAEGEYVLVEAAGSETGRVPVQVIHNSQGWTAIDAPGLRVGDRALVSG